MFVIDMGKNIDEMIIKPDICRIS